MGSAFGMRRPIRNGYWIDQMEIKEEEKDKETESKAELNICSEMRFIKGLQIGRSIDHKRFPSWADVYDDGVNLNTDGTAATIQNFTATYLAEEENERNKKEMISQARIPPKSLSPLLTQPRRRLTRQNGQRDRV
ncbi:MAG: hypothetical protein ACLR1G_00905 [Alistipes indistinctus]